MNFNKLKGKLVEKRKTYEECAIFLRVSITTFSKKMNGKSRFYYDEIIRLVEFLELSKEEVIDIFYFETSIVRKF